MSFFGDTGTAGFVRIAYLDFSCIFGIKNINKPVRAPGPLVASPHLTRCQDFSEVITNQMYCVTLRNITHYSTDIITLRNITHYSTDIRIFQKRLQIKPYLIETIKESNK